MSLSPYGPSPFDAIAGYLESKEANRKAAQDAMTERPRARGAAAVIVNRTQTTATVEPIAVVDFYPEGDSHAQR